MTTAAGTIGMRARVDALDWSQTALGPRDGWCPELRTVVEQVLDSGFPKAVCWGPSLITIYNDAFAPILGNKQMPLGKPFSRIWSEVWDQIGPIADRALAGEATYIENFPLVIERGGMPEEAWFTFCYSPLRLADGTIGGMLDTVVETTLTMETQAQLRFANQELAHRLKNTLAIVQSIARQTLREHVGREALDGFDDRLRALGQAHDVLSLERWAEGAFCEVVSTALRSTVDPARIDIQGPDLALGAQTTLSLAMLLHELSTNALKHGALSAPYGRIALTWEIVDEQLHFSWRESGGPAVVAPQRRGFGSRLIGRGLGYGAHVSLRFEPQGFEYDIRVPLAELRR